MLHERKALMAFLTSMQAQGFKATRIFYEDAHENVRTLHVRGIAENVLSVEISTLMFRRGDQTCSVTFAPNGNVSEMVVDYMISAGGTDASRKVACDSIQAAMIISNMDR